MQKSSARKMRYAENLNYNKFGRGLLRVAGAFETGAVRAS
jgi:hypothetical protein